MYQSIYIPVDNSPYSNRAVETALQLGKHYKSKLVGCHVYAARMHDYRFKQMEYTLPDEYLQEQELERQRKIHDSLITMGLELISDSYLDQMDEICERDGLEFERRMMDGKHYVEIVKDLKQRPCDLVVIGGQGIGASRDSQLGSVCAQVARNVRQDIWVVKHVPKKNAPERDTILVAVDGSPQSFGGLLTAIDLAKANDKKIELISVYDPYLHYSVFNGIVDILSERAKKIFRFEEQNQLHEEIIDTGLAQIYQSHLNVAETMCRDAGILPKKTLLDGKAFQKILTHIRKTEPWLVVMGRIGVHSETDEEGLGNTTDNLLRLCPSDMLLSARVTVPKIDLKADESIKWTDEAKQRMTRVPSLVRGIARTGILRLALEQGHSVITNAVIDAAMDRFMPKYTAHATEQLAEELVIQHAAKQNHIAVCKGCGVTAKEPDPKQCAVCGGSSFDQFSQARVAEIAASEGGIEEDTSYDGRKLKWSRDARLQLREIKDAYKRRRAKARIEKSARIHRLETITLAFAQQLIDEELGDLLLEQEQAQTPVAAVGSDPKPASAFKWNEDAVQRLLQVPAGFMRERTQQRVETIAVEQGLKSIEVATVESGLEMGREAMRDMLSEAGLLEQIESPPEGGGCPFHASLEKLEAAGVTREALNEVGVLSQFRAMISNPKDISSN